jgi:tetratricopeptide (TPR) repeat protein
MPAGSNAAINTNIPQRMGRLPWSPWHRLVATALGVTCLMVQLVPVATAPASGTESDGSLEPEFRQLREKLGAVPEFSGADAESKFRLAEALAHRGDMLGAIETYRAAIQLKPDWADPYRGLGQALLDHHEYPEAAQALQASIRLGRGDHQAFYWLGRAFMGKGDLPAAANALMQAAELKPDDAETFADLGLVRMAEGDAAGAQEALTRSIELKPDYAEAHQLRDLLMKVHPNPEQVRQTGLAILQNLFGRE